MSEPRIVTPQEAQAAINRVDADLLAFTREPVGWNALAHTVATEPDRTRAAVVKALRRAGCELAATNIENGADL